MANVRRFLRYDLKLPLWLELCDEQGLPAGLSEQDFWPDSDRFHLEGVDAELRGVLDRLGHESGAAAFMLHQFNMRLNFLAWLLEKLSQNEDPRDDAGFDFRVREDAKVEEPDLTRRKSKIGQLLHGLFMHIDLAIKEVLEVVRASHDRLFVFPQHPTEPFDHARFVTNLETVAEKGSLIARAVLLLEEKLNTLLKVLSRLKAFYRMRSAVDEWPVDVVNLSAGGVGIWRETEQALFSPVNVFLALDDGVLATHGKVVFCRRIGEGARPWRLGIDFEWLPAEKQRRLTLFVQYHEVDDTLRAWPDFPGLT